LFSRLIPFVRCRLGSIPYRIGRGHERIMNEHHRIIEKERILHISLHKIAKKVAHLVRIIGTRVFLLRYEFPIRLDRWIPETLASNVARFFGRYLPEKILVEARFSRTRSVIVSGQFIIKSVELPLSRDRCLVTGFLH
jgi:hypothetical protein